jgi:hypothetical protein
VSIDAQHLIGHWPLAGDPADHSPTGLPTASAGVDLTATGPGGRPGTAARFDGRTSRLEVADHPALRFGTGELTVAAWVDAPAEADVAGSLVSPVDPSCRRGLNLDVVTNGGVTSTAQANYRQLHFGIDDGRTDPAWTDVGRPGEAVQVAALCADADLLYAGTFEAGADQRGHLWRYDGGQRWIDLGNPVGCNAVQSVAAFDGALYCGTGRYIAAGSALGETRNPTPGGHVYRVTPDGEWLDCGQPGAEGATPESLPVSGYATGKADDAIALTVYRGALYAVSNHRRGVFRYDGGTSWAPVGLDDHRCLTLTVYRRHLYALINGGPVFRYDGGQTWVDCGCPAGSTQTYAATIHRGRLYAGTWPHGEVFRYDGDQTWSRLGRVGYEREVMGMAYYNGKSYLGTLPMAGVWRLDAERPSNPFAFLGTLDQTPAPLRRVWSLAVFQGRLFAGTLPSGHVLSLAAGKVATWERSVPAGWHHVAAVKRSGRLETYFDGQLVARSEAFHQGDYDLSTDQPLLIGAGAHEAFDGRLCDVRLYRRALDDREIGRLAATPSPPPPGD